MDKQRLIDLAEELLKEEKLDNRGEDLLFLKRQYKFLSNKEEETFYESQLTVRFNSLYEELPRKYPNILPAIAPKTGTGMTTCPIAAYIALVVMQYPFTPSSSIH